MLYAPLGQGKPKRVQGCFITDGEVQEVVDFIKKSDTAQYSDEIMLDDNTIRHFKHVNLGFACDTPRGLIVPTIFGADQLTLLELSERCKELAVQARDGKLSPDDMGFLPAAATWGYRSREEERAAGARVFLDRPEDILNYL